MKIKLYNREEVTVELMEILESNELYEKKYNYSALKVLYEEAKKHNEVYNPMLIAIGFIDEKPVALSLLLWFDNEFTLKLKLLEKDTINISHVLDKDFSVIGDIHAYVKPEHRNRGYAKELIKTIEEYATNKFKLENNADMLPCMTANPDMYDLFDKNSRYVYPLNYPESGISATEIERLTLRYMAASSGNVEKNAKDFLFEDSKHYKMQKYLNNENKAKIF